MRNGEELIQAAKAKAKQGPYAVPVPVPVPVTFLIPHTRLTRSSLRKNTTD